MYIRLCNQRIRRWEKHRVLRKLGSVDRPARKLRSARERNSRGSSHRHPLDLKTQWASSSRDYSQAQIKNWISPHFEQIQLNKDQKTSMKLLQLFYDHFFYVFNSLLRLLNFLLFDEKTLLKTIFFTRNLASTIHSIILLDCLFRLRECP